MQRSWLILDVSNLAYKAMYTTGWMENDGDPTGVLYGLFRDVFNLRRRFNTDHIVWCFDSRNSHRKNIYPQYKEKRLQKTVEEKEKIDKLHRQLDDLRKKYLPVVAHNIFYKNGYEADDMIACAVNKIVHDDIIIVSGDEDLYQLLHKNVSMYSMRKDTIMNKTKFKREYGIKPSEWSLVKALAGCSSDNIKGIEGIGEKTVCKWINNTLSPSYKTFKKLEKLEKVYLKKNLPLVQLPFDGLELEQELKDKPDLHESHKDFTTILGQLGIKSLGGMDGKGKRE